MTSRAVKPNRKDSGHRAVARCRVPAASKSASVGRGLGCVPPFDHGATPGPGKTGCRDGSGPNPSRSHAAFPSAGLERAILVIGFLGVTPRVVRAPTAQPRGGKGNVPDRPPRTARDPETGDTTDG